MKLAFSSNAYLNHPIDDTLRRIAAAGYAGVELLADVPHAWPAGLLEVQKQAIRDVLDETGLAISNINAFMMNAVADPRQPYWHPSWTDPDPHYRAIRREHTKRSLQLAAQDLGAPHITTEPGGPAFDGQSRVTKRRGCFAKELLPLRGSRRVAWRRPADRTGAGPVDRAVRPVPRIRRHARLAAPSG